MTKDELENRHISNRIGLESSNYPAHTRTSIEYAISVLEEIRDNANANQFYYEDAVKGKIKELQSLIE